MMVKLCVFLPEDANLHPDSHKPVLTNPRSGYELDLEILKFAKSVISMIPIPNIPAPPSYGEYMEGPDCGRDDSDNEYTAGNWGYRPKYITYGSTQGA